jgi:hypothetical protein
LIFIERSYYDSNMKILPSGTQNNRVFMYY